jgi:hypothetical protein
LPRHDTFSRVFRLLDPSQFQASFQRFMAGFSEQCQGVVAIDDRVLRFDRASGKSAFVDQGGDYALALKGNQGTLHDDVRTYMDDPASKTAKPVVEADQRAGWDDTYLTKLVALF